MAASLIRSHERRDMEGVARRPNVATFAANVAISCRKRCHFLPFLAAFATQNSKRHVADPGKPA